jgi:enoyl-CoA hydratase/carnithine racemase
MLIEHQQAAPGVSLLTLNRPPANALSPDLLAALDDAVKKLAEDGTRAAVLTGKPGMFSAGLDVPLLLTLDEVSMLAFWKTFVGVLRTLALSPVPVGVAISGHSPAGGTVLSIFADYRVAAAGDFKLGLNEVEVGLPMPPIVFHAFRRLLGARAAEQYAVDGSLISPDEALACGLVDAVVQPEDVVDYAVARARKLASLPAGALSATRELARADLAALFGDLDDDAYAYMNQVWFGEETRAAMSALVARLAERRKQRP